MNTFMHTLIFTNTLILEFVLVFADVCLYAFVLVCVVGTFVFV